MFKYLKKILLFAIILFSTFAYADDWIFAGEAFSLKQNNKTSESLKKVSEVLPQLILEQLSSNKVRIIPEGEILDRKLNDLQTKRLALFLELSKEVKVRDSLVLKEKNPKKLEKKIIEENKKIADIQKKIEENLNEADSEIKKTNFIKPPTPENDSKNSFQEEKTSNGIANFLSRRFFRKDENNKIVSENISLYKNDSSILFKPTEEVAKLSFDSYEYSKAVLNEKINGILTGSIVSYGDYIGVTTTVYVYPGAKQIGSVTEVGMISDLVPLANRIIQNLSPKIANSLPVLLDFDISIDNNFLESDLVLKNPVVTIDDIVHSNISEPIIVDSGIHTISVEAQGFESTILTYSFTGDSRFYVKAKLIPLKSGIANIRLSKFMEGVFYTNAIDSSTIPKNEWYSQVSINGKDALSVFEDSKTKERAFILIPSNIASDGNKLVVNVKPFDRAKNIDNRRKSMYLAYSALICSLPFTFYSLGEFTAANNALLQGHSTLDNASTWQNRANITQGISIACGVWFGIELVRYLYAANRVLPATAKIDKKSENFLEPRIDVTSEEIEVSKDENLEQQNEIENIEKAANNEIKENDIKKSQKTQ